MTPNVAARLSAVALFVAAVLVLPLSALADDAADQAAILDVWDTYETARVAGDVEGWLALWDAGGIQMPPGTPARGMDALAVGIPLAFAAMPASTMGIVPEEVVIMGDWAFSRGNYTAVLTIRGTTVIVNGKFMTIFRRQDDGSWKIYRDIFNANG